MWFSLSYFSFWCFVMVLHNKSDKLCSIFFGNLLYCLFMIDFTPFALLLFIIPHFVSKNSFWFVMPCCGIWKQIWFILPHLYLNGFSFVMKNCLECLIWVFDTSFCFVLTQFHWKSLVFVFHNEFDSFFFVLPWHSDFVISWCNCNKTYDITEILKAITLLFTL